MAVPNGNICPGGRRCRFAIQLVPKGPRARRTSMQEGFPAFHVLFTASCFSFSDVAKAYPVSSFCPINLLLFVQIH